MLLTSVITCMGRLAHLKRSLPLLLEHTDGRVVVVDWSCPDRCGEWIERHVRPPESERVCVVRQSGESRFHKARALNLGLRHAVEAYGPGWLCVLDADTLVAAGFGAAVAERRWRGAFLVMAIEGHSGDPKYRDLSGLVVMHSDDYLASGGYDEWFREWGGEDWDMRCRLFYKLGLRMEQMPVELAEAIEHSDAERVRHLAVGSRVECLDRNVRRIDENVRCWTGKRLQDLPRDELRWLFSGMW